MSHIHKLYDFVVSAFIVYRGRILLVHHKRYGRWLPIGGHIELDEDPELALMREIREECGLKVRILAGKPRHIADAYVKPILSPSYVDVHRVKRNHKHIAFVYFARAKSSRVRLHEKEHRMYRWFTRSDLYHREYNLYPSIRFYCLRALACKFR